MCFANSVLQVLAYCAPFHNLFSELSKLLPPKTTGSKIPLVDATIEFLSESRQDAKGKGKEKDSSLGELQSSNDDLHSFLPTYVYDALKEKKQFDHMRGGHQEDAEEFLGFYLDTLEEELMSIVHSISPSSKPNSKPVEEKEEQDQGEDGWLEVGKRNRSVITRTIKSVESPITRIFGGKFRSTLKAPQQKDSVVVEDWRALRLDIQRDQIHTLHDALTFISHPQPVQLTLPHPSRPGQTTTVEASQQILVEALPPILVLHMKRFCYEKDGGVVKVGKRIVFSEGLEVPSEILIPAMRKPQIRYKLFGVVYHHGISASGGHYTLDVVHPTRFSGTTSRQGWIRIDDELISDLMPEDVFNTEDRGEGEKSAYLLLYRRVR